jgi:hypothetical protein
MAQTLVNGWHEFTPDSNTRIIYVDATSGGDGVGQAYDWDDPAVGADPFNPVSAQPYQSIAAGIAAARDGFPDWVLLKRGEAFTESGFTLKSGLSDNSRFLVGAYGSGERPVVATGTGGAFFISGDLEHSCLVDIDFYAHTRNPSDPSYTGRSGSSGIAHSFFGSQAFRNFLMEGCRVRRTC